MRSSHVFIAILSVLLSLTIGCSESELTYEIKPQLNPNKISPLTAELRITSNRNTSVTVKVLGDVPVSQHFEKDASEHVVPVVGLYPDEVNQVEVTLTSGKEIATDTILIKTYAVPEDFPTVEVVTIERDKMEPGMHLADFHLANNGVFSSRPLLFDDNGVVRWYLNFSRLDDIIWPIQKSLNGNLLLACKNEIREYDMLGKLKAAYSIDESIRIHHDLVELPNGQLLLPIRRGDSFVEVDGKEINSLNDMIVLFDRDENKILRRWDLPKNMDVTRHDMINTTPRDWFHMNAVVFNPADSTLLVSGKNQGLVKLTWDDELVWILSPHRNWGTAGRRSEGFELSPFLLTAVDENGNPYQKEVQSGKMSHPDFDFPWGQHAPEILPNGDIILFDNGYMRNFIQHLNYSRAVQYSINEKSKTVQQKWQYGKERGPYFFSMLISDVDYLPKTENILVTAGFVDNYGTIVEVDPKTNEVVFEAKLNYKTLNGNKTFNWGQLDIMYRSSRFDLSY
jgi:arylsulfate sulfotransferase